MKKPEKGNEAFWAEDGVFYDSWDEYMSCYLNKLEKTDKHKSQGGTMYGNAPEGHYLNGTWVSRPKTDAWTSDYSISGVQTRGTIAIMDGDVEVKRIPAVGFKYEWDELCKIIPESEPKLIRMNRTGAEIGMRKKTKPSPLMCLYTSVFDFCQRIMGVTLSPEDSEFFRQHPLTEADGVSMANTLRVAQELIEPYNLQVSRVQVMTGMRPTGDLKEWQKVLGVNPLAALDRTTTNQEFSEQTGDTTDYRFEFNTLPLKCSIVCGTGTTSAAVGVTGGHAAYRAPRGAYLPAWLSFQIERNVPWKRKPVFPPPQESEDAVMFDLQQVRKIEQPTKEAKVERGHTCVDPNCEDDRATFTYHAIDGICDVCWERMVGDVWCSGCSSSIEDYISKQGYMVYSGFDRNHKWFRVTCSVCRAAWSASKTHHKRIPLMVEWLCKYRDKTKKAVSKALALVGPSKITCPHGIAPVGNCVTCMASNHFD